jgi:hypothetical protein
VTPPSINIVPPVLPVEPPEVPVEVELEVGPPEVCAPEPLEVPPDVEVDAVVPPPVEVPAPLPTLLELETAPLSPPQATRRERIATTARRPDLRFTVSAGRKGGVASSNLEAMHMRDPRFPQLTSRLRLTVLILSVPPFSGQVPLAVLIRKERRRIPVGLKAQETLLHGLP